MISCVPASSENSFAHLLHFQYASYPIPVQVGAFFSTFLRAWPFAFISTGLMISCVPASSENSFAHFLHLQYASYPVSVQLAFFWATFSRSWPIAAAVCTFSFVCCLKASFLNFALYVVNSGNVQFFFCTTCDVVDAVSLSTLPHAVHFLSAVHFWLSALHL